MNSPDVSEPKLELKVKRTEGGYGRAHGVPRDKQARGVVQPAHTNQYSLGECHHNPLLLLHSVLFSSPCPWLHGCVLIRCMTACAAVAPKTCPLNITYRYQLCNMTLMQRSNCMHLEALDFLMLHVLLRAAKALLGLPHD